MNPLFRNHLIVIKSGGDLASGVAYRLKRAGFPLILTELPTPLFVRRTVSFGEAVYADTCTVEGIAACRVDDIALAQQMATTKQIPVVVDTHGMAVQQLQPTILIDAIMAKRNTGTGQADAAFVVGLGPGFTAGEDCHAVIETMRGHRLGRVLYHGQAAPNTGMPGIVGGVGVKRVLRAPAAGQVKGIAKIGDRLNQGQPLAIVAGQQIAAPFDGVLRGLIHPSVHVKQGLKIGDLDPRCALEHCFTISDKALSIGGGVLEAVMSFAANRLP